MRSAGLLLHVTSLPGGRLGEEAFRFVDFCAAAGQRWWQMLPVVPPNGSPYTALSAFAGDEALLAPDGSAGQRGRRPGWLKDYALFRALRDRYRGAPWTRWPRGLRRRQPESLFRARRELAGEIARHEALQCAFDHQWRALKEYANTRGVRLIGDLPLFVAGDSADVWAHQDLFRRNVVAGVPPDYFSKTGQRWGNPHYHWEVHKRRRYRWWLARLARMFELFDAVRMDHFLGLHRAWEIPARARTARKGRWRPGPGAHFLAAVRRAAGDRLLIAEDLGLLTPEAAELRDRFGLPGMRVLHFSFGDAAGLPHTFPANSVVYTGTHDNDTTVGWFREGGTDRKRALAYAGCTPRQIHWGLIRVAHLSAAGLAVVPVQDLLGLDGRARMNRPGRKRGNWRWRLKRGQLRRRVAQRLRRITETADR